MKSHQGENRGSHAKARGNTNGSCVVGNAAGHEWKDMRVSGEKQAAKDKVLTIGYHQNEDRREVQTTRLVFKNQKAAEGAGESFWKDL